MVPSYIGALAGLLSTVALIPQVVKTHQTKHTRDLSLGMVSIAGGGAILWILYGFMIADLIILISNIFVGAMFGYLVLMKIKHG